MGNIVYILFIIIGVFIFTIKMIGGKKSDSRKENSNNKRNPIPKKEASLNIDESAKREFNKQENEMIQIKGNSIYITRSITPNIKPDVEIMPVFKLEKSIPEIAIYENDVLYRKFVIEPKDDNPDLKGQYFHSSIRLNSNSSVQIDGIISTNEVEPDLEQFKEGIRFQPFFLSDRNDINISLAGKGMFQRGLHYSGLISSSNIRLICICDSCRKSFSVEFYHAGFSEVQYFYSSNSKQTLIVPYTNANVLKDGPFQTQQVSDDVIKTVEAKLPASTDGEFKYYNSFKCPHCNDNYIDFSKNKDIRPNEYYLNFYLNQKPIRLND